MINIRDKIITQARSWIGTKFKHQGRLKKTNLHSGGCDCLGLVMGVAQELSLLSVKGRKLVEYDNFSYPKIPPESLLLAEFNKHFIKVDTAQVGDLILFNINEAVQHIAIYAEYTSAATIIHAYAQAGKVVEHNFDITWKKRIHSCYKFHIN